MMEASPRPHSVAPINSGGDRAHAVVLATCGRFPLSALLWLPVLMVVVCLTMASRFVQRMTPGSGNIEATASSVVAGPAV